MDVKDKGIIIKLTNYAEADKLASVFSLNNGVISAKFAGVKKEKAKFKAVAQPFCLADFVLAEKNGNFTVTQASVIDNFFGLVADYNKTICGYIILDILNNILPKNKPEPEIFLATLNALKELETAAHYPATIGFIVKFIDLCGMGLEFFDAKHIYLDKTTGNFTPTPSETTIQIDKKVYNAIKNISQAQSTEFNENKNSNLINNLNTSQNQPTNASETTLKQALRLLHNILLAKFGEDLKSFTFI